MAQPNTESVVVRGYNQKVALDWKNKAMIADQVIPVLDMQSEKEKVHQYNKGDAFRDTAEQRAEGTKSNSSHYKITSQNIDTEQYSNKNEISKEALNRAGLPLGAFPKMSMERKAMRWNANKLLLKREILTANNVLTGTWADGNSGGEDAAGLWADTTSSNTLVEDLDTGINKLQDGGVPRENLRLMVDAKTWQGMIRSPEALSALGYNAVRPTAPGLVITTEMMASLLTIEKVLIGGAIYNSANEAIDGSDFTVSRVWGGTKGFGFLYYFPPVVSPEEISPGFIGRNKMENGEYQATWRWYDNDYHKWIYEAQENYGYKQTCSECAYLWKNTHTT